MKSAAELNADVALARLVAASRAFRRSQNPATEADLLDAVAAYDVALRAVAGDWRELLPSVGGAAVPERERHCDCGNVVVVADDAEPVCNACELARAERDREAADWAEVQAAHEKREREESERGDDADRFRKERSEGGAW